MNPRHLAGAVLRHLPGAMPAGHRVITGRHAAVYDRVAAGPLLGWLYRAVAGQIGSALPAAASVLDVGTGPGRLLVDIARRRPDVRVVGIDPSPDMVAAAQRRVARAGMGDRVEVRTGAAEDLPFPDGSFDAVTSTLSAHHWADLTAAVAEQARVLRPGGFLWVYDLRGVHGSALEQAAHACLPGSTLTRSAPGRLAGALLVCYRVGKRVAA